MLFKLLILLLIPSLCFGQRRLTNNSNVTKADANALIAAAASDVNAAIAAKLDASTAASTYVAKTVTVNGHALSGDVSVTATDVGLGNVSNTSDAAKPVSTATQTALDLKANLVSPVFNSPTIGISGTSASSHIKTVGSIPTVTQTGGGNGGSVGVALETGSTDHAGIITLTTGNSSVGSTGTVTLTFNGAYVTNQPVIVLTLVNGSAGWGALATCKISTQSLTAPVITWNNSATGAAVALSTGQTYKIAYMVIQK